MKRIAKVKARIAKIKRDILQTKRKIKGANIAAKIGLLSRLHTLEILLHRDRHLLDILQRAAVTGNAKQIATATKAAEAADAGKDPAAVVPDYPMPTTAPPAPKTEAQAVAEADAEAADPTGAMTEAINAEAAGEAPGGEEASTEDEAEAMLEAEVAASGSVDGSLLKSPLFWGSAVLLGVAYWKRNVLKSYVSKVM